MNVKPIDRKSRHEMNLIKDAGAIVAQVHLYLMDTVEPGMSTLDLDQLAEAYIRKHGAIPTFKGLYGFPGTLCTSVNEEVVHGIPRADKILQSGDIISVDCGVTYRGYIADTAVTIGVGPISEDKARLLRDTEAGLLRSIAKMVPGNTLEDIAGEIEDAAREGNYGLVIDYGGHGTGRKLHEEPFVFNYRRGVPTPEMRPGNVLAIEPMFNLGTGEVETLDDHWTVVTKDRLPSAHFEHTVIVTEEGPFIATERIRAS